jgi:hypothetical protein
MTIEHMNNTVRFNTIHDTNKQSSNLQLSMKLLIRCFNYYKLYMRYFLFYNAYYLLKFVAQLNKLATR